MFMSLKHMIIIWDRHQEECQNYRSSEPPDDRPWKSAPDWISHNNKTSENSCHARQKNRHKSFFRSLNNCFLRRKSIFQELFDIINKDYGIPYDNTSERYQSNHWGCCEIFRFYEVQQSKSWKDSKEREKECFQNHSTNTKTLKLSNNEKIYSKKRETHSKSEISKSVHSHFPFSTPLDSIFFSITYSLEIDGIERFSYFLVSRFFKIFLSKYTIEIDDRV